MVEPQIVVLVVAGSSPVGHPANLRFRSGDVEPLKALQGYNVFHYAGLKDSVNENQSREKRALFNVVYLSQ